MNHSIQKTDSPEIRKSITAPTLGSDENSYSFHKAATVGEIMDSEAKRLVVNGCAIALFHVEGEFLAIADKCTHGDASLSDGFVEGCEVECPLHSGRFDLRTGKAVSFPCIDDVQVYPIRVEGETVLVGVAE